MAEIHPLSLRPDRDGTQRLVKDLEYVLSSGAPLGPRWAQIQASGLGLQHLCDSLRRMTDQMTSELASTPELEVFRANLYEIAEAFSRIARAAQREGKAT